MEQRKFDEQMMNIPNSNSLSLTVDETNLLFTQN